VTTSRTKASEAATGATHAAKTAAQKAAAGKAVPKPARAATGAKAAPPTRRTAASAKSTAAKSAAAKSSEKDSAEKETSMTVTQTTEIVAGVGGLPPYRTGEDPWTPEEVGELQAELEGDAARLHREIGLAETGIADLLRDSGEGAGDDQADAGTKNFEREHEMSIANNARDMLTQTDRALARLAAGTYGICESCGEPVGKYRLQAFPRATLCMSCKQKQERR
jgi:RNA polymerase-binding protein DksA